MQIFSAFRDFADGLSRGFSLFFTDRNDNLEKALAPGLLVRFGEKVRELRQHKGVSQERLAELCGLHRTYVSSVERGERNISLLNIAKLAAALDVSLTDIMPKAG